MKSELSLRFPFSGLIQQLVSREGDDTTRDFFLSFVLPNFYEVTTVEVITDVAVNHTTMEASPTFSG